MDHGNQPTQYIEVRSALYETQVIERLARMEVKLDNLTLTDANHDKRIDLVESKLGPNADHETRLRKLEKTMWIIAGAAAAGGGTAGGLIATLVGG